MTYDVNYYNQILQVMPPNKRTAAHLYWLFAILSPLVWLRDVVYNVFKKGQIYSDYVAGTYAKGDRVRYQRGVYESRIDGNTDNPLVADSWYKLADNFIGMDERVRFSSARIVYEYALNKWFSTDSLPCIWSEIPGNSTIYITNNTVVTGFFRVAYSADSSSSVGFDASSEPIPYSPSIVTGGPNYTINIPTAVYTSLGSDVYIREATVRNFADKLNPIGLNYDIQTY